MKTFSIVALLICLIGGLLLLVKPAISATLVVDIVDPIKVTVDVDVVPISFTSDLYMVRVKNTGAVEVTDLTLRFAAPYFSSGTCFVDGKPLFQACKDKQITVLVTKLAAGTSVDITWRTDKRHIIAIEQSKVTGVLGEAITASPEDIKKEAT
jgi:hypothetical protein